MQCVINDRFLSFSLADHLKLDAQISAQNTPGQVEGYGNRLGLGKVPVFRISRNRVHGCHGLSKSTSEYIPFMMLLFI